VAVEWLTFCAVMTDDSARGWSAILASSERHCLRLTTPVRWLPRASPRCPDALPAQRLAVADDLRHRNVLLRGTSMTWSAAATSSTRSPTLSTHAASACHGAGGARSRSGTCSPWRERAESAAKDSRSSIAQYPEVFRPRRRWETATCNRRGHNTALDTDFVAIMPSIRQALAGSSECMRCNVWSAALR
jgi:hypothetical protein